MTSQPYAEFTTPLVASHPLFTNVNAAEAIPVPMTALTASLLIDVHERAFRWAFGDVFGVLRPDPGDTFWVGMNTGFLYFNASAIAHAAARAPWVSVRKVAEQYTGSPDASFPVDSMGYRLASGARQATTLARELTRLGKRNAQAAAAMKQVEQTALGRPSPRLLREIADRAAVLWGFHLLASIVTSGVGAKGIVGGLATSAWSRVDEGISRERIAACLEDEHPMSRLEAEYPEGRRWVAQQLSKLEWVGVEGLELSSPTWAERPEEFLRLVAEAPRRPANVVGRGLRAQSVRNREATKILTMRAVSLLRKTAQAVAHELGVPPEIVFNLRVDELESPDPSRAEARREARASLSPGWAPTVWDSRAGAQLTRPSAVGGTLRGVSASGGRARGMALVGHGVFDVMDRCDDLGILVIRSADPAWAPLIPFAEGIVSETGGQLSHIACIAREVGIPFVANVAGACTAIPEGANVIVDGDRATVDVTP